MQATTMTDIQEMEKNITDATFNVDQEPETLEQATTAPQEQLDKLGGETPKQPGSHYQS